MIPDPHSLVTTGGFGGLSPPPTIYISGVLIKVSECQANLRKQRTPCWWLFVDGSGPAVCKFLTTKNRRPVAYLCKMAHMAKFNARPF